MTAEKRPPIDRKRIKSPCVTVVVSERLIYEAEQRDSGHCMISEAIKEAVPTAQNISTDLQTIRWSDPAKRLRYTYLTPRVAQIALIKFDQGIASEPFQFRLGRAAHIAYMFKRSKEELEKHAADLRRSRNKKIAKRPQEGCVPTIVGGKPPPIANLADPIPARAPTHLARRRAFGLRQLRQ
jgi:hypothetical protein